MYVDGIVWFKYKLLTSSCLIFLLIRFILIVDSAQPGNPSSSRQMCLKLQSMLSYGKYQTSQISSNITYTSRIYAQNFLAYSSIDDLLLFIEPKHQINVYNARTIQLIVNISTTDVVIALSTTSLFADFRNDLFFIYETNSKTDSGTNLISLRVCQVRFNMFNLNFENNHCIETITLQYDQTDLRINGFTIKRDHAGTKKSILFISTDIGIIYSIFDTYTGSLIGESTIMNETLNEGSIVLSSSGSIYYASKQEHLIYELQISRDFRLRYGNIIKANSIKYPFGLITDECNHLYIATRSMILVMFVRTRTTIRSVFSKASDLPLTLERLNSTTYVYATIKKSSGKMTSHWMFNFLYFTDPERVNLTIKRPAVLWNEKLDFNNATVDNDNILKLWPLSYPLKSTANTTKKYVQFSATARKTSSRFIEKISKQTGPVFSTDGDRSSIDENKLFTPTPSTKKYIPDLLEDPQLINPDENLENDDNIPFEFQEQNNQPLETRLEQNQSSDSYSFPPNSSKSTTPVDELQNDTRGREKLTLNSTLTPPLNRTIDIAGTIYSEDDIQSYLEGRGNLSSKQEAQIQAYLAKQSSSDYNIFAKYSKTTSKPSETYLSDDNLPSEFRRDQNTTMKENMQSQDYAAKRPSFDSKFLNRTIDAEETIFSDEEIQSYLQGRTNLSAIQEGQIQAYISKQISSNHSLFSKYLTSTKKPTGIFISNNNLSSTLQTQDNTSLSTDTQSQDSQFKQPLFDSKSRNRTIDIAGTIYSEEDIQSYLEGRGNLSTSQEAQIQDYLAKQSLSNYTLFSRYSKPTKPATVLYVTDDNMEPKTQDDKYSFPNNSTKHPFSDSDLHSEYFDHIIDSNETLISDDDLKSYLEGRSNLSAIQKTQIQAYLARQSSSYYNIFSKYSKTTRNPSAIVLPEEKPQFDSSSNDTSLFNEDSQFQNYLKQLNRTTNTDEILFSDDDLKSYLQGRGNLSTNQEAQIQAYLARQSSLPYNLFSKYSTSTKKPRRTSIPGRTIQPEFQRDGNLSFTEDTQSEDYSEELFVTDSKSYNRTTDSEEMLFTDDELRSYLEGRGNLSKSQEAHIQAYLAKQSSLPYNMFSKYSTSTKKPRRTLIPGRTIQPDSRRDGNMSLIENIQSEDYSEELSSFDPTHYNHTKDSKEILFTDEDLKSYLQGRGNLSLAQKIQIQAYLARQSSLPHNLFSKYSTSTRKPRRTSIPGRTKQPEFQRNGNLSFNEDTQSEDYSEELFVTDSKSHNRTTDSEEMLFTDDELRSYLEGRGNLSKSQEAQIQAYLARQSSLPYNPFSKYSTSTKKPRRTSIPGRTIKPDSRRDGNLSFTENIQSEDYSEELPPLDPTHYNGTTDSKEMLFSNDDLRSYLEGRANLSKSQEAQIQAYLARQSSLPYNLFSKYSTSTRKPRRTSISGRTIQPDSGKDGNMSFTEDTKSEDYSEELSPFDPTFNNRTIVSKEMLFSDDELRSYLEGRANLSKSQEAQIQAYLARQSSLPYNPFSKYSTSTKKPRRTSIPGRTIQPDSRRDGNLSYTEDTQSEHYSEERLPFDPTHYNYTTDSKEMLFSEDDLKSYLQGRGNLSLTQKIEIQAFLARQSSSNHSIFWKYSKTTKLPTRIYTSDNKLHPDYQNEDTESENYLTKTPVFDSKYFNFSTDSEEILFSEDELQSYLQGRGNLSLAQEAKIRAYLAKQTSLGNNTFSRYFISTRKPTKILTYDDKLQIYSEEQTNLSLSKQLQSSESASQKLTSTIPYTTRKRTSGRGPSQSVVNGSSDFDDSIEELSDIYTDSNVTKFEIDDPINRRSTVSAFEQLTQDISNANLTSSTLSLNDLPIMEDHSLVTQFEPTIIDDNATVHADDYDRQKAVQDDDDKVNPRLFPTKLKSTIDPKFAYSSSLSVDISVSSTPHPSSPITLSSTTSLFSPGSRLSSPLHRSLSSSSTKSPKFTRLSSSKLFSEMTKTTALLSSEVTTIDSEPTTELSYSTLFPSFTSKSQSSHKFSSMQTTDAAITSSIPKEKSITTPSSPFTTHHPRFMSTISSTPLLTTEEQIFTTKSDRYTSESPKIHMETSSLPYVPSSRLFTTLVPSTNLDSSSTVMSDKTSSRSSIIATDEENLVLSDNRPFETTEVLSRLSDKYQEEFITTQSSFELVSTMFSHFYKSKTSSTPEYTTFDKIHPSPESTLPFMRRTSYPSTTSTITTTTTTERRYRTRKQKITRWQTQQLSTTTTTSSSSSSSSSTTTTTTIPSYQTTSIYDHKSTTSTQISIWHSEWNPLEQQEKFIIKPPLTNNGSNTGLTNDLLNQIFNNITTSTNSSSEKSIYFNLIDLPPSSWNLSLNSSANIVLDVTLPSPVYPSYSNTTTNLTFTNIQANRFSTNINGMPINLQLDRVHTKQFSLIMNTTDNVMNRNPKIEHSSDIIIGHVKSEQFELNLTKSDNMHVHVEQVDSATAELYLDSNFCTNESSLEINLNLSKNGTIRYGNRKPIHIGPVFTRVHMLKQSCDREQPLTLFFDICERQNPCLNGGTCLSVMPDYNDISYVPTDTGHIGYKCHCPLHTSGEHCQDLEYPLGYCINGGTLFQINDRYNKSIQKCICPIGFRGEHCEENIDNCIGIGCSGHGMCEDGIQTYKCLCYDGFYGFHCERTNVQTVLLQAASRSFGVVAILLIAGIAGLVVASDIHTYLTRKQQKNSLLNKIPRATSELFENSVLLLGFSDAPIEMNDLSKVGVKKKLVKLKQRQTKRTTRNRRPVGYRQLSRRRQLTTFPKSSSSRRYLVSSQSRQTIL